MAVYEVEMRVVEIQTYTVEAESAEEAVELAWDDPSPTFIEHVCMELNDVDNLFIGCVREWVKAVFYAQNPMPVLKYLLSNHKIQKTMIPIDDLMRSIVLSRTKKLDFRVSNCCFLGESEKIPLLLSSWLPLLILVIIISIGLVRINEK